MYCTSCGNQINDNARFCPHCGAATSAGPTARPTAGASAAGQAPHAQPASGKLPYRDFPSFLAGTKKMGAMPLISLIMFFIYGTYNCYSLFSYFGRVSLRYLRFGNWVAVLFPLAITVMFALTYFKKTQQQKRLFFLIGLAILLLMSTIIIFSRYWFNIVFGLFLLAVEACIAAYYAFEGRIINERIKKFACIGLMVFGTLEMIFYSARFSIFALFFLYAIPYAAIGLGFLFYSPYDSSR
ncbi:MAG: zinc ribbon domain-containing protein [Lachnospiraceae bacterium]|nr:zinc ribbon domain-containing protein [Lachnospiraceae bacterium]